MDTATSDAESNLFGLASWSRQRSSNELLDFINTHQAILSDDNLDIEL